MKTLWSIYFAGMDEYEPFPGTLDEARQRCHEINDAIIERGKNDENEPNVWASPAVWPFLSEDHAAAYQPKHVLREKMK